jgi:hypothetical protein
MQLEANSLLIIPLKMLPPDSFFVGEYRVSLRVLRLGVFELSDRLKVLCWCQSLPLREIQNPDRQSHQSKNNRSLGL